MKAVLYIFKLPYKAFIFFLITLLLLKDKPIPPWMKSEAMDSEEEINEDYEY